MRARVSAETLRRLAALEKPKTAQHRGVLVVPEIVYDLDEWQAVAIAQQARLVADVRN
jgi:hypothetical protein